MKLLTLILALFLFFLLFILIHDKEKQNEVTTENCIDFISNNERMWIIYDEDVDMFCREHESNEGKEWKKFNCS
jgi:hypothetical protein